MIGYKPTQRDIVIVDSAPSKGYEIRRRRPVLVMNKDSYNISTNLATVCPITPLDEECSFLVPIHSEKLHTSDSIVSKVNTL